MFVTSGVSIRRAELLTASSSTCKPYTQNNGAEEAVPMSDEHKLTEWFRLAVKQPLFDGQSSVAGVDRKGRQLRPLQHRRGRRS